MTHIITSASCSSYFLVTTKKWNKSSSILRNHLSVEEANWHWYPTYLPSHIQQTSPVRPSCFSFSSSFFSRAALRVTSAKPWNCEKASAHLLYITCSWVTASQYLTGQQDFKNPKVSFLSWISNKSIHISEVSTPEVNHGQIFQKLTVVFKYSINYGICLTMSWCKLYDFQDQMQRTTSMPF